MRDWVTCATTSYVPQRKIVLHCRFIKNIYKQHNLTKEMPNKTVQNTEVRKTSLYSGCSVYTAGSCVLGQAAAHTAEFGKISAETACWDIERK
jgi:hypothetical protein